MNEDRSAEGRSAAPTKDEKAPAESGGDITDADIYGYVSRLTRKVSSRHGELDSVSIREHFSSPYSNTETDPSYHMISIDHWSAVLREGLDEMDEEQADLNEVLRRKAFRLYEEIMMRGTRQMVDAAGAAFRRAGYSLADPGTNSVYPGGRSCEEELRDQGRLPSEVRNHGFRPHGSEIPKYDLTPGKVKESFRPFRPCVLSP